MAKNNLKVKVISLKPLLDFDSAEEMVDSRKVKTFQTLLHKPKKSEIHQHSLTLHYESILLLSGKYSVDFIRDADSYNRLENSRSEIQGKLLIALLGLNVATLATQAIFLQADSKEIDEES